MPPNNEPDSVEALEMNVLSVSERHERSRSRGKSLSPPPSRSPGARDYAIGIILLLVVVFLWTSSNFLTQDLYEGGYAKPFLVTYLNTAAFSLYLVPFLIRRLWSRYHGTTQHGEEGRRGRTEGYEPLANDPEVAETVPSIVHDPVITPLEGPIQSELPPLTVKETASLASIFCFFWFIANWALNASLDYTSVASSTILSSMSGFFTLGIGRIFHVETLTIGKISAVLTSFGGVILVSLSDSSPTRESGNARPLPQLKAPQVSTIDHAPRPVLGDILALLSAMFYALYVVLLKVRIRSESRVDMQLFFGFVGLFSIVSCWPIGILLHVVGVEKFELPTTSKAIAAILTNMFITLSSDYLYVLSMLKTTPLVVTIGLSLTIPLAVIGDFFLGRPARGKVIFGAILVLISFVAVGWEDSKPEVQEDLLARGGDNAQGMESQLPLREEIVSGSQDDE